MSQFGSSQFGSSQFSEYEAISSAIDASVTIPIDAKQAIKKFLRESFGELWQKIQDIVDLNPPDLISEYWNIIIDIITHM